MMPRQPRKTAADGGDKGPQRAGRPRQIGPRRIARATNREGTVMQDTARSSRDRQFRQQDHDIRDGSWVQPIAAAR
jgi:hypothetical protein